MSSNKMEQYDLYLTPLSPLHLGTDEDYSPTNYVMDKMGLHAFDHAAAMRVMTTQQRTKLERMVTGRPDVSMVQGVQKFFGELRSELSALSTHTVQVGKGVLAQYEKRLGTAANREQSGRSVINQLEIQRTFYNPVTQQSIIPGSGIKGAIRTALLNHLNDGKPVPHRLKREKQANRILQQQLLRYSDRDMHQDPLRLLHLQDAAPNPETHLAERKIYFAVNRKRSASRRGEDRRQGGGPTQRLESLLPTAPRAYRGGLATVSVQPYRQSHQDKVPSMEFSAQQIASYCNAFYRPIFEEEIEGMVREGYLDSGWQEKVETLLNEMDQSIDENKAFLVRLGQHSGAESVTLDGVRDIKIKQGKDKKPRYQSKGTTWWMAAESEDARSGMIPFGWALVELVVQGGTLEKRPAFDQQIAGLRSELNTQRQQREAARSEVLAKLEKRHQQEQEQLEAQRIAAEEEQLLAERKAAMSEQQLAVQNLREGFEKAVESNTFTPQGEVAAKRAELLKTALEWEEGADRQAAWKLLTEMVKLVPWSKKKKKEYQGLMRQLSGDA